MPKTLRELIEKISYMNIVLQISFFKEDLQRSTISYIKAKSESMPSARGFFKVYVPVSCQSRQECK